MSRQLANLVLLLLVPSALAAQTFPSEDPVLRRIWTLGMDSSQTYPLAQALMDSIGPRLTGSPGIMAGNDWLVARYRAWGIEARNEKPWKRPCWPGVQAPRGGSGSRAR